MKRISTIGFLVLILILTAFPVYAENINTFPDDPPLSGANFLIRYNVEELEGIYVLPPTNRFGVVKQNNPAGETLTMFHGAVLVQVDNDCRVNETEEGQIYHIGEVSEDMKDMVPFVIEMPSSVGDIVVRSVSDSLADSNMVKICTNDGEDDFWFDVNVPFHKIEN